MALLDEESRFPKGTDETLLDKQHKQHEKQEYYEKPKTKGKNFVVKHYAGNVSYESAGFLEKNRDTLGTDMLIAVQTSTDEMIRSLFPDSVEVGGRRPATVGSQFRV